MISPDDTMAASLWRAHLGYTNTSCLESKQTALSLLPRPALSTGSSSRSEDNSNDLSDLPYLCTEPVETKGVGYTASSVVDSLGSDIDSALLMAMLSGDVAEASEHPVHPRPMLHINPISIVGALVLSTPSPVDSGYGSRPDTPLFEMCEGYGLDESTWSPVDDTSSISDDSSNTHMLSEGFSDAKYWDNVTDAKTTSPAPQGPVIPRIILSDEEGRVVEATINDRFGLFSQPGLSTVDEDADSPYGGLMSLADLGSPKPAFPASRVSPASKLRNSATGAVLNRAFVSLARPRTTPLVTTSIYHNRHRAPTFVLDCVGEEEEQRDGFEEESALVGAGSANPVLGEQNKERVEPEVDVECVVNTVEAFGVGTPSENVEWAVKCLTGGECNTVQGSMSYPNAQLDDSSAPTLASERKSEFNTWYFEDGEDDECEECGLLLTEPDDNYLKLLGGLSQLASEPTIMFGLLNIVARSPPTNELNTAYHVTVQGRAFRTADVSCPYDCERGFWNGCGGLSSIVCPRDCPAHGGCEACDVDAIFHHSTLPHLPITEPDCAAHDYQAFAIEVVGLAPTERKSTEEDWDDSDLVLHSGEKFRPTQNKNASPKAGASYDEYMSRFMDDVDLSNGGSNDNKNAPFGKLVGGALKDMTMPEAVDHLKEGLEKTESAFRAALAAPFRFNSVADRLTQHLKSTDPKINPPKERRSSNAFRHHRKESSVSGIKTKWSNMLNKFTR